MTNWQVWVCPNCGGNEYDAISKVERKCRHCGTCFEIEMPAANIYNQGVQRPGEFTQGCVTWRAPWYGEKQHSTAESLDERLTSMNEFRSVLRGGDGLMSPATARSLHSMGMISTEELRKSYGLLPNTQE